MNQLGLEDVGASYPHRVTYHPTCHGAPRGLRLGDAPLRLLRAVPGLDLVELPEAEECCGFGGTFAVKNADTSSAMLADKLRNVVDTGAEVCTAGDSSCLMHMGGGLSRMGARVRTVWRRSWPRHDPGLDMTSFPDAAREALRDDPAAPQPHARHARDPRQARPRDRGAAGLGAAARRRATRSRTARCATSTPIWSARAGGQAEAAGPLGEGRGRGVSDRPPASPRTTATRGGQGQVAHHRRDRPERGAMRPGIERDRDRPGRADHPAGRRAFCRTFWCRRSTRTAPRFASCSCAARRGRA